MKIKFMNRYTVILCRPEYLCAEGLPFGQDVYVGYVSAESATKAVGEAQTEVFLSDKKDKMKPKSKYDYAMVLVFDGHIAPKLWSWML